MGLGNRQRYCPLAQDRRRVWRKLAIPQILPEASRRMLQDAHCGLEGSRDETLTCGYDYEGRAAPIRIKFDAAHYCEQQALTGLDRQTLCKFEPDGISWRRYDGGSRVLLEKVFPRQAQVASAADIARALSA